MRHGHGYRKLGRTSAHRLALFRSQLASLVDHERIVTTLPKAKELRPIAERVITQGKRASVHARRLVNRWLLDRGLVHKLFEQIVPRFESRPGGYLRIVKLGPRVGDGAEMAVLEFVDYQLKKKVAKPEAETGKKDKKGKAAEAEAAEAVAAAEPEAEDGKKPAKKKAAEKASKPAKAKKEKPSGEMRHATSKGDAKPRKGGGGPSAKKGSAPKKMGGS